MIPDPAAHVPNRATQQRNLEHTTAQDPCCSYLFHVNKGEGSGHLSSKPRGLMWLADFGSGHIAHDNDDGLMYVFLIIRPGTYLAPHTGTRPGLSLSYLYRRSGPRAEERLPTVPYLVLSEDRPL